MGPRSTDASIQVYQQAGMRAVHYQLQFQQPDGAYIWEGYPCDAYHKQPYSWSLAGCVEPAHRLLSWAETRTLRSDGQLQDYRGDVYKHAWFFHGAHRLGRFDLSYPVMSFLLTCQASCGGFPHFAGEPYCRSLSTCMAALAALYAGRLDVAETAAAWALRVLEQQPEPNRFYYRTTLDGRLVTPALDAKGAYSIDFSQPKQVYWEIGLPLQLMCRLYQATGAESCLEAARRFWEVMQQGAEDRFTFTGSGKSALGAALFYLLTGDRQARADACSFADFLVSTQLADGSWHNPDWPQQVLYHVDAAAEFNVWLQEIAALLPGADARWC